MEEVTPEVMIQKARSYAADGKVWHFHILTPGCVLNDTDSYAFILENESDNLIYFHSSNRILRDLGKELATQFHGAEMILEEDEVVEENEYEVTLAAKQMLDHARELNLQNKMWHHHLLFPYCTFNESKGKWNLVLEDPDNDIMLKSVSDDKPEEDLKEVEALFSAQDF